MKNYQDFQLIDGIISEYEGHDNGSKFTRFFLHRAYGISITEINNFITDKNIVSQIYKGTGVEIVGDKGIDAIYIDQENKEIHLLNFKYINNFEKTSNNFDGGELPKVKEAISQIFEKNEILKKTTNPNFISLLEEIWDCKKQSLYKFKILFVTNGYTKFTSTYEEDLKDFISSNRHIDYDFVLLPDIVEFLADNGEKFNGTFRAISKNFFEKSGPGVRTFVCEISGKDLLRLSLSDDKIRTKSDATNEDMKNIDIQERIFDSNVRHYLKQRGEINQNIKNTALDQTESSFFFYYNNGITVLCDSYDYNPGTSPLVEIEGIQIVNGSQTIHSLKEAFDQNPSFFDEITILTRIYETKKDFLYTNIAKYTNSQNAINSRDLRTNDLIHTKIKEYLLASNINYIIKRGEQKILGKQNIEIDTVGQILLSWNCELPGEAKNKKSIIFGENYQDVFNDNMDLKDLLKYIIYFNYIEEQKILNRSHDIFLAHSSWYILFFMKKYQEIFPKLSKEELYSKSVNFIKINIIADEKIKLSDQYSDAVLFKGNKPKEYLSMIN